MTTNDGGPAFPCETPDRTEMFTAGMTLRDWFAGQAMAGFVGRFMEQEVEPTDAVYLMPNRAAAWAYRFADAMLAARES